MTGERILGTTGRQRTRLTNPPVLPTLLRSMYTGVYIVQVHKRGWKGRYS